MAVVLVSVFCYSGAGNAVIAVLNDDITSLAEQLQRRVFVGEGFGRRGLLMSQACVGALINLLLLPSPVLRLSLSLRNSKVTSCFPLCLLGIFFPPLRIIQVHFILTSISLQLNLLNP